MGVTLRGERVVLRALDPADARRLRELRAAPEVARWWHPPGPGWPLEGDEHEEGWVIEVDGEVAGWIEAWEGPDPDDTPYAGIDVLLGPDHIGRGLGTEAVRTLARHLVEDRGHHRLTIDPDVANARAIRCYEKVGFRPVGVMRAYARSVDRAGWRDALLMDLLADELR